MILPPARLRVVLDRPDHRYVPGDVVGGRIEIDATKAFAFDRLVVALGWATRGEGDVDSGSMSAIVHGGGSLEPGTWSFPFELALEPLANRTFRGALFSVDWAVSARLEVPWASDPYAEEALVVVAPPQPPAAALEDQGLCVVAVHPSSHPGPAFERVGPSVVRSPGASAIFGGLVSAGGIGWMGVSGLSLFPTAVCLVGGAVAVTSLRRMWANAALERLELYVGPSTSPPVFARGEPIACLARVTTRGSARVRRVLFELLARERAIGHENRTWTHDHSWDAREATEPRPHTPAEVGYREAPSPDRMRVFETIPPPAGEQRDYAAILSIPRDAPARLDAAHHSVRWLLRVFVELSGAPDWDEVYDLYERL